MADQKPNNAPEDMSDEPVGEPAVALQDIASDMPGGGGLGGDTAAEMSPHRAGGPSPNAPAQDVEAPGEGAATQAEAVSRVADDPAITAHPRSS